MAESTPALDPRFATRPRRPGLDLLRAAAIVLVVCYHAGNFGLTLPHDAQRFGWIGVDLFFVLSGYLIGGQLLAPLARGGRLDLRRFFWRRALRILPAYLVVLAVYVAFPSWREWPHLPPAWKFLCFVQNIDLHGGTAFSHAWSLCVEAQFYTVLPFLFLLFVRRRGAGIVTAASALFAGLVLRAALGYAHPAADGDGVSGRAFQNLIYYPTWARLDPLVLGVGSWRPSNSSDCAGGRACWVKLAGSGSRGARRWRSACFLARATCSPSPRASGSFRSSPSACPCC